jgi:hypothetical protein
MSLDAMIWAWKAEKRKGLNSADKLVLLSLADRADENNLCYPSQKRLTLDTWLDLKTVKSSIRRLIDFEFIKDTGERVGKTKSVIVYELINVSKRENADGLQGKLVQKRTKSENGASPNFPSSEPKNGLTKLAQKRTIEPTIIEPINEPITQNNKKGNENEQTNLEFNEPEKQNLNPNLGTHEEQVEFGFDKPEPKRRFNIETFADNVAEVWDEIAIQSNIKSPGGRKSAASSTSRNNITKIIKLAKKSESKLDYKSLDAWRKYFTTLIAHTNDNPVVAPGRSFKWAVKEKTYEQLTNDDYLRWSSNKRMA